MVNQADVDALATVCEIGLGLEIKSGLANVELPALAVLHNGLTINLNTTLTNLSLPALREVGSTIFIEEASALTSVSMPVLANVNDILIDRNGALTSLSLPALTNVNRAIAIGNNFALTTLSMPVLETVGDGFGGAGNLPGEFSPGITVNTTVVTDISFPALRSVGTSVSFLGTASTLSLPLLETVTDTFHIVGLFGVVELSFPSLTTVGTFFFGSMSDLQSLSAPALVNADVVDIFNCESLTSCEGALIVNVGDCVQPPNN